MKKLIATCYDGSPVADTELSLFDFEPKENKTTRQAHKIVITEVADNNADGAFDLSDIKILLANKKNALTRLKGNGDFRSEECIELLKEADFVCTNPPFSLFREYIAQLIAYDKKFIVIGDKNAITYKEIFPLIKENKLWLGYTMHSGEMLLRVMPNYYEKNKSTCKQDRFGNWCKGMGVRWFTNLDHKKRYEEMILYRTYSPETYPKYDNYDAINVDKVADIPCDYDGVMGVPITFLDKHNPDQFEIVGMGEDNGTGQSGGVWNGGSKSCLVKGKATFKRIFIRKKK